MEEGDVTGMLDWGFGDLLLPAIDPAVRPPRFVVAAGDLRGAADGP